MEGLRPLPPNLPLGNFVISFLGGPAHPVSRCLSTGDSVGQFRVIHAPGHTEGHSVLFRENDGVLIAGDVLANINFVTGAVGLREPPHVFSTDWRQNRESVQIVLDLEPGVICFGHGPPLEDMQKLRSFCRKLETNPPAVQP
ncbi:MAG: MBL fold metallo-hydrolase [Candidatus Sumerlaeaceae bacterium]